MRIALVALGSFSLTAAIIANAFIQKQQFYPAAVFITKSNPSMAVLYIQAFVLVLLIGKMMRKVFFGQLRAAEMEHLIERFWYAVTETCLAFTVFRDDFSPKFVALFTLLLFLKAFHWLAEDRIDYMERSPMISFKFHIRALGLLMFLGLMDSILIHHAFRRTMQSGASVQLVFGFEIVSENADGIADDRKRRKNFNFLKKRTSNKAVIFLQEIHSTKTTEKRFENTVTMYAILLTMVVTTFMKYVLHTIDLQRENPWENKTVFLLYTDLITGFIKVLLYIVFVAIMIKIHTFPLFAIRPMYLTLRAFKKSVSDVVLSRRAIAFMNSVYPDATEEELAQMDNVCIICREEMTSGKKLPCNHIFHAHCLRSWFQRQQSCPTCRMDVLRPVADQQQQQQQRRPQQMPGQQPPQAQQPQNAPGFGVMGMPPAPPFAMWNPLMAPPPPMPQQPGQSTTPPGVPASAAPAEADPVSTARTEADPAGPSGSGSIPGPQEAITQMPQTPPPFFMPPFMFSPMLGMMPPPMPPFMPNLSGLTDEQLRAMEGQERENVEARIRILRNVHSLLDSAILQLNQYSQVISAINSMSGGRVAEFEPAPSTSNTAPDIIGTDEEDMENISEEDCKDSVDLGSELRKRRLEKFSASTETKTENIDSKNS